MTHRLFLILLPLAILSQAARAEDLVTFDSIEEMHAICDKYKGATTLAFSATDWKLK